MHTNNLHLFFKIQTNVENIATISSFENEGWYYGTISKRVLSKDRFFELYTHAPQGSELDIIKRRWMLRKITALPLCFYNLSLAITKLFLFAVTFPLTRNYYIDSAAINCKYSIAYLSCLRSDPAGLYSLESLKFDDLYINRLKPDQASRNRDTLYLSLTNPALYPDDLRLNADILSKLFYTARVKGFIDALPHNVIKLLSGNLRSLDYHLLAISQINSLDFTKLTAEDFYYLSPDDSLSDIQKIQALNTHNLSICINRNLLYPHQAVHLTDSQLTGLNPNELQPQGLAKLFTGVSGSVFRSRFALFNLQNNQIKSFDVIKHVLNYYYIHASTISVDLAYSIFEKLRREDLSRLGPQHLRLLTPSLSPNELNSCLTYFQTLPFDASWTKEHIRCFLGFQWLPPFSYRTIPNLELDHARIDYLMTVFTAAELFRTFSARQKALDCVKNHPGFSFFFRGSYYGPGAGGAAGGAGYSYYGPGAGGAAGGAGASRAPAGPLLIGESYLDAIIKKTDSSPKTTLDALRLLCPTLYTKYKGAEVFKLLPEEAKLLKKETLALQRKYHPDKVSRSEGESDAAFAERNRKMNIMSQTVNAAADIIKESDILA